IYATRRVLERAGAEALLAAATPPVADLERRLTAMQAAASRRDMRGVIEADAAFHTAIVAVCGARRLTNAESGALRELRLALSVTDRAYGEPAEQAEQHQALLDAFRNRDPDALALLDRHLAEAADLVAGVLDATGIDRPGRSRSS